MNSEQREQVTQLEALTAEVVAYGWKADLYLPAGRLPYLSVYDPADATAHGDVVAMPDSDSGHWWFWFTWAERIALVENLGVAAEIIVGVLRQPVSLAAASPRLRRLAATVCLVNPPRSETRRRKTRAAAKRSNRIALHRP